ncbi:MAG TPA: class I SAM-dependent methyltransferase [Gaiellaceae bacterium]|nr:class I SAM-dependent methyltransferase [Gaiellaceae bacterium]
MTSTAHPYDEAYYVGGGKSNYLDYAGLEPTIEQGFMPVVLRYAAWTAARHERRAYLDVGCAMGFYVRRLAALGWDAHGVDLSEYAVAEGRRRGIANLSVAPAQALPFTDGSFDLVTSIDVIEHLQPADAHAMVAELRRVLRAGGLCLVATPNFLTNRYWNVYAEAFEDRDATHVNYQSVESLRAHFEGFAGCEIHGDTPFKEQFHAFDVAGAFDRSLLRLPLVRAVGRHVAWKLLGRSVEYSSYLHAVAIR